VFVAMIVSAKVNVSMNEAIPPPKSEAELPERVELVTVSVEKK
jgi:hypothetical protein